jgi:hypothetical protein
MASGISGHLGADDYASMYESRSALTTVQKQHFVEWFSGSALDSIWTKVGSDTTQMEDTVDGGYSIDGDTDTGIYFNDKRQYAHNGSEFIIVTKRVGTGGVITGFSDGNSYTTVRNEAGSYNNSSNTYYQAMTSDTSTQSTLDTDVTVDTTWRTHKGVLGEEDFKLYIDGVLKVTKTTNLPIAKMQPMNIAFSSGTCHLRYFEAYNT